MSYEPEYFPRILYAGSSGNAQECARVGISVIIDNNFSRKTWAEREAIKTFHEAIIVNPTRRSGQWII